MTLILVFLAGFGIGGAFSFVTVFDHFKKKLEEEQDISYGMGYSNGLADARKPGSSIQWAAGHGPDDHPGKL